MAPSRADTVRIILAYAGMCLIWGSTWTAIKVGLRGAPPLTGVAVRMLIATALVYAILRARRIGIPRQPRFVRLGVFLGFFHIVLPYSLVYYAEQRIPSHQAAILYATLPLMVAVLARFALGDPLTWRKLVGIAVGIAGVGVIFAQRGGAAVIVAGEGASAGVGCVLASVLASSIGAVATKRWSGGFHPLASLLIPFAVATVVCGGGAVLFEDANPLRFDAPTWASIVYLAAAGSVTAFALFFYTIQHLDVTVVAYQTFIIPIIAVLIGFVLLGETLSPRVGAGAALILAGIALATLRPPGRTHGGGAR